MKFNNRAQIGATISWFVGFLTIILILIVFLAIGIGKNVVQSAIDGKPKIEIGDSTIFGKSEQQRQMFVLFEGEFENKTNYDIVKSLTQIIQQRSKLDSELKEFKLLNQSLTSKKSDNCFSFYVLDKKTTFVADPSASGGVDASGYDIHYYFYFPKRMFHIETSVTKDIREGTQTFFFPEKPFALIKYISTKCPEEKDE